MKPLSYTKIIKKIDENVIKRLMHNQIIEKDCSSSNNNTIILIIINQYKILNTMQCINTIIEF